MITSKDIELERKNTKKVLDSDDNTIEQKLSALYKLLDVTLKVGLNVRMNTKLIMNKLGIELIKNKRT